MPTAETRGQTSAGGGKAWAALAGYAQTRRPTRSFEFRSLRLPDYFPGQCPGEHIGAGAPPSANEAVDIAPNNTKVASNKRAIFFIEKFLPGDGCPTGPSYFSGERKSEVFEKRAPQLIVRRYTDDNQQLQE